MYLLSVSLMLQNLRPSVISRSFKITRVECWFQCSIEISAFFSADKIRRRIRLLAWAWDPIRLSCCWTVAANLMFCSPYYSDRWNAASLSSAWGWGNVPRGLADGRMDVEGTLCRCGRGLAAAATAGWPGRTVPCDLLPFTTPMSLPDDANIDYL